MSKNKTRTKDKYRVVYNDTQRIELENEFRLNEYIAIPRKQEIAQKLQLSERQIKIWFQNRRAKKRKQQKRKQLAIGATTVNTTTSQQQNRSPSDELTRSSASSLSIHQYGHQVHNHHQPQLISNCSASQLVVDYHDSRHHNHQHQQQHQQQQINQIQRHSHPTTNNSTNDNDSSFDLQFQPASFKTISGSHSPPSSLYITGNNNNNNDNNTTITSTDPEVSCNDRSETGLTAIGRPVVGSNASNSRINHNGNQLLLQQSLGSTSSSATSPGSSSIKPGSPSSTIMAATIANSPIATVYGSSARKWSPSGEPQLDKRSPNLGHEQPIVANRHGRSYQQQHEQQVAERLGQMVGNQAQITNSSSFYDSSAYNANQVSHNSSDYYATMISHHHNQQPIQQEHLTHHSQPHNQSHPDLNVPGATLFHQQHHNNHHQHGQPTALADVMVQPIEGPATIQSIAQAAPANQSGQVADLGHNHVGWSQTRSTAPNPVTPQLSSGPTTIALTNSTLSSSQSTPPAMLSSGTSSNNNNHHHHHHPYNNHNHQFHLGSLPHLAAARAQQVAGLPMSSPYTASGNHQGPNPASSYATNSYHPHHQHHHHNHHSHHQLMIEQHYANSVVDHAQSYIK